MRIKHIIITLTAGFLALAVLNSGGDNSIVCEVGNVEDTQKIASDYGFILSEYDSVCININDKKDFTIPDSFLTDGLYKVTFEADDIKEIKKLDK